MPPQRIRHLAKHHGLVLVRQHLLGNLELQIHVLCRKIVEEYVHGLLLPRVCPLLAVGRAQGFGEEEDAV